MRGKREGEITRDRQSGRQGELRKQMERAKATSETTRAPGKVANLTVWLAARVREYIAEVYPLLRADAVRKSGEASLAIPDARPRKGEFFLLPGHDASSFGRTAKRAAGCNATDLSVEQETLVEGGGGRVADSRKVGSGCGATHRWRPAGHAAAQNPEA